MIHKEDQLNQLLNLQEYLRIKQAAAFMGVHVDTLRRWERRGLIKPIRNPMNVYRLYKQEDLSRILIEVRNG